MNKRVDPVRGIAGADSLAGALAPTWAESPRSAASPAIACQGVRKCYVGGDGRELVVLDGVELEVQPGEAVAIVGASGAGKSTLLHLLGGLDRPTAGRILLGGQDLASLPDGELPRIRNRGIGFVFQFHHLLREFTAIENVMMPLVIGGMARKEATDRARGLLEEVGLGGRLSHKSWQLSGGEQQRVAVARALASRPLVLLADEPSGNLDTETSEQLHDLFFRIRAEHHVAMVVATHNRELANRADRVLLLSERQLRSFYRPSRSMLCDHCGEHDAVIHLTQIVNNQMSTFHLCETCAAAKGLEPGVSAANFPLTDFLAQMGKDGGGEPASGNGSCSFCSLSMDDFKKSGRLGCPHCYVTFESHLRSLLRRLHGGTQHLGKVYLPPDPSESERQNRLAGLRRKLEKAIAAEDFERAARLRDQIRSLEGAVG